MRKMELCAKCGVWSEEAGGFVCEDCYKNIIEEIKRKLNEEIWVCDGHATAEDSGWQGRIIAEENEKGLEKILKFVDEVSK